MDDEKKKRNIKNVNNINRERNIFVQLLSINCSTARAEYGVGRNRQYGPRYVDLWNASIP